MQIFGRLLNLLDSLSKDIEISLKPQTPLSSSCDVISSSNDWGITARIPSRIAFTYKLIMVTEISAMRLCNQKYCIHFALFIVFINNS